jgi:tellurite resistance protein TehA-like permease
MLIRLLDMTRKLCSFCQSRKLARLEQAKSMHLSSEGKISIFLALIGLAGAGAIMIAPRHTEIGWSLIAIAAVGCVYLAFNHFSGLGYRDLVRAKWRVSTAAYGMSF